MTKSLISLRLQTDLNYFVSQIEWKIHLIIILLQISIDCIRLVNNTLHKVQLSRSVLRSI